MVLYFAYGSNLDIKQMLYRCPNAKFKSTYKLKGYKLVFSRHASIEYTGIARDFVQGVIYELDSKDEKALDIREGVSTGVYTKEYISYDSKNPHREFLTYIKTDTKVINPDKEYLDKIKSGYRFWGLDPKVLDSVETIDPVLSRYFEYQNRTDLYESIYNKSNKKSTTYIEQGRFR